MARFTDDEMAMLTEDERRIMEELGGEYDDDNDQPPMDPDDDPEDYEGAEEGDDAADDADAVAKDDAADDADKDEGEATDGDDGATDDRPADEGEKGDDDAPEPVAAEQQAPLLDVEMPEGFDERIKELETHREKLDVDFDDGELTSLEYRQQLREIEAEERGLREQAFEAQLAHKMYLKQQEQAWHNTAQAWLDRHNLYRQSDTLYDTLNRHVKAIANSEEVVGMTSHQILEAAHKRVTSDPVLSRVFEEGKIDQETADADARQAKEGKEDKEGKRLERRKVPPTLANVPASDSTDAEEGSRFARLDKMDGLELEAEIARLSATNPKLVEDYLSQ